MAKHHREVRTSDTDRKAVPIRSDSSATVIVTEDMSLGKFFYRLYCALVDTEGEQPLTFVGLEELYDRLDAENREKLFTALAVVERPLEFSNGFPYTQEDLRVRYKFSERERENKLASEDDSKRFAVRRSEPMSASARARRAGAKRRQIAEFDLKEKKIRDRVVLLKLLRIPEKEIGEWLLNAPDIDLEQRLTNSAINKIYKTFDELNRRLYTNLSGLLNKDEKIESIKMGTMRAQSTEERRDVKHRQGIFQLDSDKFISTVDGVLTLHLTRAVPAFYLRFSRVVDDKGNKEIEEELYIQPWQVKDRSLTIDICKHTVLTIGAYGVEAFFDLEDPDTRIDKFRCRIGAGTNKVEGVEVLRSSAMDDSEDDTLHYYLDSEEMGKLLKELGMKKVDALTEEVED